MPSRLRCLTAQIHFTHHSPLINNVLRKSENNAANETNTLLNKTDRQVSTSSSFLLFRATNEEAQCYQLLRKYDVILCVSLVPVV